MNNLKNKKILITAGPTWVPIDSVRVISNIATGRTGILLAEKFSRYGAKVTLLLGHGELHHSNNRIRIVAFRFFEELQNIITRELNTGKYDVLVHSAAVSDYSPKPCLGGKVKSGRRVWRINLFPTTKIIDSIKKKWPDIFLVGFKFEPQAGNEVLMAEAKKLLARARLNLVVANTIRRNRYLAYIIKHNGACGPFYAKNNLAGELVRLIGENL